MVACRARAVAPDVSPVARLYVLMVNGGGSKAQNYQSHFLHLRRLLELLARAGVPSDHIALFSADGPAPEADMAVREIEPEADFRLLRGTRLAAALGTQIVYANSEIPGVPLQAATRAGLTSWFKQARRRLRPGDTLLVYVTDHGSKNDKDTADNRIVLWGEKESISVKELAGLTGQLDPGVRVVALMSQCFSGAFANLMSVRTREGQPSGPARWVPRSGPRSASGSSSRTAMSATGSGPSASKTAMRSGGMPARPSSSSRPRR